MAHKPGKVAMRRLICVSGRSKLRDSYTNEDFVIPDGDPEAGDIAYVVARKPS